MITIVTMVTIVTRFLSNIINMICQMNQYILFGALFGFIYFLYKLESPGMGNVLFRVDSTGNKIFSLESLIEIIKSPFIIIQFWTHIELFPINWILTTGLGGFTGWFINEIFKN